ncbi:hypothetical protein Tco_0308998 [Tanacetum coccineum]
MFPGEPGCRQQMLLLEFLSFRGFGHSPIQMIRLGRASKILRRRFSGMAGLFYTMLMSSFSELSYLKPYFVYGSLHLSHVIMAARLLRPHTRASHEREWVILRGGSRRIVRMQCHFHGNASSGVEDDFSSRSWGDCTNTLSMDCWESAHYEDTCSMPIVGNGVNSHLLRLDHPIRDSSLRAARGFTGGYDLLVLATTAETINSRLSGEVEQAEAHRY